MDKTAKYCGQVLWPISAKAGSNKAIWLTFHDLQAKSAPNSNFAPKLPLTMAPPKLAILFPWSIPIFLPNFKLIGQAYFLLQEFLQPCSKLHIGPTLYLFDGRELDPNGLRSGKFYPSSGCSEDKNLSASGGVAP